MTMSNIFTVLKADLSAGDVAFRPVGVGSFYSYIASGTSGQTATVSGSIDGQVWVMITTLTVTTEPDFANLQHVYPHLKASGTATLSIARSAA
jgi:hypothetical protein